MASSRVRRAALDIRELTDAEEALMVSISLLVPGFGQIVAAIGVEATFAVLLLLGGKTIRIPTALEVTKSLVMTEAVMDVRRGLSVNEAAAKHGISRKRLALILAHAQSRWEDLDRIRDDLERDYIRRMALYPDE